MPRRALLGVILLVLVAASAALGIGTGWTGTASWHFWTTIGTAPVPPTPPECAGMAFSRVIVGTPGDDHLNAGNRGAIVFGLGGNDTLEGGNGKDCLVGGDGDDTLEGGNGKDVLLGGDGDDVLRGRAQHDPSWKDNGVDLLDGGEGTDACYGTAKDTFVRCETVDTDWCAAEPSPSAGPTSSPEPTTIPEPSPTPDATEAPEPTPTPGPSASPRASPRGAPTWPPRPTLRPPPPPSPTHSPDTTPPTVVVRSPGPDEEGVDTDVTILVVFSEPVRHVTRLTVLLTNVQNGSIMPAEVRYVALTRVVTINPTEALEPLTTYRITLWPGITDAAGNHLAPTHWTFQTGTP